MRLVPGPVRTDLWKGFSATPRVCPPFYVGFHRFSAFGTDSREICPHSSFFRPFSPVFTPFAAQPPRGRIQGRIRGMDFFSILVFFSQFSSLFLFFFRLRAGDGFLIAVIGSSSLLSGRILGKNLQFRRFSLPFSSFLSFPARSCPSFYLSFCLFSLITTATFLFPTGVRQNKGYGVPLLRTDSRKNPLLRLFSADRTGFCLLSVSFLTFFALFRAERISYPQIFAYPLLTLCLLYVRIVAYLWVTEKRGGTAYLYLGRILGRGLFHPLILWL